ASAHRGLRRLFDVEEPDRHTVAVIGQRRITGDLAPAAAEGEGLRQVAEIPEPDALALDAGAGLAGGQLRGFAQLRLQRREVAAGRQFTAGLVDYGIVAAQVRRIVDRGRFLLRQRRAGGTCRITRD